MSLTFQYEPAVLSQFPNTVGGVLFAEVRNGPSPAGLLRAYEAEQEAVKARIGDRPLSELPSLAGWRETFRGFNVDPTKYRSAAEALLRRLTKKGNIPSINMLVDTGNLVSIRYGLPVAVFDVRDLADETLTVQFANGDEPFTPLGADEAEHPEVGEVIFTGGDGDVYARRWCWRQSARSAARADTQRILVTVEAQHTDGTVAVRAALADLQALLQAHADVSWLEAAPLLHTGQRIANAAR